MDPDCPPHFFNGGLNPQWRYFGIWAGYAQKLCALLSGGRHVAPAAVLYHAEAEWAGDAMGFEPIVRVLAEDQLDANVIPLDELKSHPLRRASFWPEPSPTRSSSYPNRW